MQVSNETGATASYDPATLTPQQKEMLIKAGLYTEAAPEPEQTASEQKTEETTAKNPPPGNTDTSNLEDTPATEGGFTCLGKSDLDNVIYSHASRTIHILKAEQLFNAGKLACIVGTAYAFNNFSKRRVDKHGVEEITINWQAIGMAIEQGCAAKGPYTPENIRGAGIWADPWNKDNLHINLGKLWALDGSKVERFGKGYTYLYNSAADNLQNVEPATKEDVAKVFKLITSWNYRNKPTSALLVIGWVLLGSLTGATDWRSHMRFNGEPGSGKSNLALLIKNLYGSMADLYDGSSTEAGLRQSAKSNAMLMLIDESESKNKKSSSHYDLARGSSTGNAKVVRGSTEQAAHAHTMRFSMGMFGVSPTQLEGADVDRYITIDLAPLAQDAEKPDELDRPAELQQLGERLIKLMIEQWPNFRQASKMLHKSIRTVCSSRFADTYANVMAAAYVAFHPNKPMTEAMAANWRNRYDLTEAREASAHSDPSVALLEALLAHRVQVEQQDVTIRELMRAAVYSGKKNCPAARELAAYGLRAMYDDSKDSEIYLFMYAQHAPLRTLIERISKDTPDINRIFGRLIKDDNGGVRQDKQYLCGDDKKRSGIRIPTGVLPYNSEQQIDDFKEVAGGTAQQ